MAQIANKFHRIGVRVKVTSDARVPIEIDVERDLDGEYFAVRHDGNVSLRVLDVQPEDRHLLLTARRVADLEDRTFLCGHDERAWFVAAIPDSARAQNVQQAKDALKPHEVWDSIRDHHLPMSERDTRQNAAFLRQGEWFFLPRPWLQVNKAQVLEDEPIRRGAGKPHVCQFLTHRGGQTVYVNDAYPNGLTSDELRRLPRKRRKAFNWRSMVRDGEVYVKGTVRHPDHATIDLPYWHRVVANRETEAAAMRDVAFLD